MSVSEQPARLAVKTVEDLVGLVPYLLGFHPEESLVVIVLQRGQVAVTARVDLAAVAAPVVLADLLGRLFERFPGAEGWFLAFTDDDALAWEVLTSCVELVGADRIARLIQAGSGSWRSDGPDGPTGATTTSSPAAAQATLLGMPARRSRRELAGMIVGPPAAELAGLTAETEVRLAEVAALSSRARRGMLKGLLRTPAHCTVADCVRLAVLADQPAGQVAALRHLAHGNADQQLALWTQVARHTLAAYRPTVLSLLGFAAWQTGDGALQVVCLEELERAGTWSPLAGLLGWVNASVTPPHEWEQVRPALLTVLQGEAAPRLRAVDPPASRRGR